MRWSVFMFKLHGNKTPGIDFRCVLRCVHNHMPFFAKPAL